VRKVQLYEMGLRRAHRLHDVKCQLSSINTETGPQLKWWSYLV